MTVDREKAIEAVEPIVTDAMRGYYKESKNEWGEWARKIVDAVLALPDREKESYEQRLARRLEDPEYRAEYERAVTRVALYDEGKPVSRVTDEMATAVWAHYHQRRAELIRPHEIRWMRLALLAALDDFS